MAGDVSKGLNEVPDGELAAKKEPDSTLPATSESAGGEHNPQSQIDQKEIEHLASENFGPKDDAKISVKSLESSPGASLNTSMLSKNGAVFSRSYLSRISVSQDLVEPELYNRCISLLGDLNVSKTPKVAKNELVENNGNIGNIRNHGTSNLFSSLYLKSNNNIFQRAMALHNNQSRRRKFFAPPKTEGKVDLTEAAHDTEMLDHEPKEPVVGNLSQQHNVDIIEEGSPSKQEPGDDTGAANAAATESACVESLPAILQPDDEMEAVAPQAITEPGKDMEDVVSPSIEVSADVLDDGVPQVTLEHAADLRDATPDAMDDVGPSAIRESSGSMDFMPPGITESSPGKEDASAAASPPNGYGIPSSVVHDGADIGMEDEMCKAIGNFPGNGEANSSSPAPELDVTASDAQDSEAMLVESRVNLSRIPNSPESTH